MSTFKYLKTWRGGDMNADIAVLVDGSWVHTLTFPADVHEGDKAYIFYYGSNVSTVQPGWAYAGLGANYHGVFGKTCDGTESGTVVGVRGTYQTYDSVMLGVWEPYALEAGESGSIWWEGGVESNPAWASPWHTLGMDLYKDRPGFFDPAAYRWKDDVILTWDFRNITWPHTAPPYESTGENPVDPLTTTWSNQTGHDVLLTPESFLLSPASPTNERIRVGLMLSWHLLGEAEYDHCSSVISEWQSLDVGAGVNWGNSSETMAWRPRIAYIPIDEGWSVIQSTNRTHM